MSRVTQVLGCIALLAFCWLAGESALTIRYARQRSVYTFDQLNKVLRETSQTLDEVRKGATTWQQASKNQSSKTTAAMSSVGVAAAALTKFISRTDKSVNSSVLPTLTEAISSQNAALLKSQQALQDNLSAISSATSSAQKVLVTANERLSDPAIANSLANIDEASKNAAESTKQVQLALTDVRQMADKARETYLKPVNLWWQVVKTLLPLAGSAAQVIK